MDELRIIITGGGTGGHLFPALAIGEEIKKRNENAKIHYIGSIFGLESKVYPVKDVIHTLIPIRGIQRNLNFANIKKNFFLPFNIIRSILKIKSLINNFSPQIIIGTGGYASAISIFISSKILPTPLIILQEQNSFPGLTNRIFSKKAKFTCIAFSDAEKFLKSKTILTGNPIRDGIDKGDYKRALKFYKFKKDYKTIFLFGGSQGSSFLNNLMKKITSKLRNSKIQIIWQTGDKEYFSYKNHESDYVNVTPFIHNMADAYTIADLIISRSGALTLAEITICGKPSILIPLPSSAANHQLKNARVLEKKGAALLLEEKEIKINSFFNIILNLLKNDNKLKNMSFASKALAKPNSTNEIVDQIFKIIK